MKLRLIELFSGIGAQAKALENLGINFEHYKAVEFDKYAMTSYNAIHDTDFKTSDITQITSDDLGIVDTDQYTYLMTYSFPCQDLSVAGKQAGMSKGTGTRSGLLWEVERLLNECLELPQILLMENVPQVHGKKNKADFDNWCEFLESKGYTNYYDDLNAKNYGIPQNRNRCFMVSFLDGRNFEFPKPFELKIMLNDLFQSENEIEQNYYNVCPSMIKAFKEFKVKDITFSKFSNTVTTKQHRWNNAGMVKKEKLRYLTPLETWRLMGFDDTDFENAKIALCDTYYKGKDRANSQLYKQAGNSICVNVLMEIFKKIFIDKPF